ncbi:hypothetical protein CY34DRAFT_32548, partial [Suillus luteus UH-Slu-Lm8-n1]
KGHWDKILSISYFPDGQRMISGSCDTTVQQWDLKTGKEFVETGIVKTFKGHSREWITCIDISADNTRLASGSNDRTARIWNLDTDKLTVGTPFKGHTYNISGLTLSFDDSLLASAFLDNIIKLW